MPRVFTDSQHSRVLTDSHIPESLPTPTTQCECQCVIQSIICGFYPMIILQNKFICFQTKSFLDVTPQLSFIYKTHVSFMSSEFLVSHRKLRTPKHFHELSPLELCITTNIGSFIRGGVYPCYYLTQVFFTILFNRVTLLDFVQLDQGHPIKHQT